jgi:hypothetical protein
MMPHDPPDHGHPDAHHGARRRFTATVDHLTNEYAAGSGSLVVVDDDLPSPRPCR